MIAPDFDRLARTPCSNRLLRVLRHEALQFGLGPFMFNKGRVGQCERGWRYVFSRRDVPPIHRCYKQPQRLEV